MRSIACAFLVGATLILVVWVQSANRSELDPYAYQYITENFDSDTGSKNGVAAILLNYRMYDTMFEALILLTAIIGMNQFLPSRSDIQRHSDRRTRRDVEHGDES